MSLNPSGFVESCRVLDKEEEGSADCSPVKKKPKTTIPKGDNNNDTNEGALMIPVMPREIWIQNIIPFLRPIETTWLGNTSRTMKQLTMDANDIRLVFEERFPTLIGYERDDENTAIVYQIHRFAFKYCNSQGGSLSLIFRLRNVVWIERENHIVDHVHVIGEDDEESIVTFPAPTGFTLNLTRLCLSGCNQMAKRKFIAHVGEWGLVPCCSVGERGGINNHIHESWDRPESEKDFDELRDSLRYVHMAAKSIAYFPGNTEYPSSEYLLRQLPTWAHDFFPSTFDWNAPAGDRETVVEVEYKRADSDEAWRESLPPMNDGIHEYYAEERPWDDEDDDDDDDDDSGDDGDNDNDDSGDDGDNDDDGDDE